MAGIPSETIAFLTDLRANNDKAWFDANRDRYETAFLAPAKQAVEDLGDALRRIAPGVSAEPRVNGSIFRINRDIRFSKDKTPYKDHLDLWFWEGDRKAAVSGFFLRITPDIVALGAGSHGFDPELRDAFRARVADPVAGAELVTTVEEVEQAGFPVHGEQYKRVPSGYDVDGRQEQLIRYGALYAVEEVPHPGVLGTARFTGWCARRWEAMAPLHHWLVAELQPPS